MELLIAQDSVCAWPRKQWRRTERLISWIRFVACTTWNCWWPPWFSSFYLIFLVLKLLHSCLKFAFSVAGKHRIVQMSCVDQCNGCVCLWLCRQDISQCNGGVYLWARHFAVLSGVYMGGFILMLKLFQSCLKYAFCVGSKHWIVQVSCLGQCKWCVYLWLGRQGISTV